MPVGESGLFPENQVGFKQKELLPVPHVLSAEWMMGLSPWRCPCPHEAQQPEALGGPLSSTVCVEPDTVRAQHLWGDDVGASVDAEAEHPASEAWRGGGGGGCVCVAGTPQPEQRGSPRTGSQEWLVSL